MGTPKHTPGPWHFAKDLRIYGAGMRAVADMVHLSPHTIGEDASNAALIASAPDLLQALIEAVNVLESRISPEWEQTHFRKIIAKATGGHD
jgi:hypothetical protein